MFPILRLNLSGNRCNAGTIASTLLVTAVILASAASQVRAGDYARRAIIGFSMDGRYFAFEQFGRQDGSGFPYSDIFLINTDNNTWVRGSPIRTLLKNERARIGDARRRSRLRAEPLIARLGIRRGRKGLILASNPVTELSANPHQVRVMPRITVPPSDATLTFQLREIPLASPKCSGYGFGDIKGFALRARFGQRSGYGQGRWLRLHRDRRIPSSRGCPIRYAISDVIAYGTPATTRVYVLILSVFSHGFEGPDRRFIAGGYRLP